MGTRPRTKALKAEQLKDELKGDLAAYEKFGLFQRSVNQKTAYRYRGALLRYLLFLGENPPTLAATGEYLGMLRKNNFDPSTLRVYRAALAGFHEWRGEELKFKVKVPEKSAKYIPWEIIQKMLKLASAKPHDQLVLRLMTDAGLRRDEIVQLKISNIEGNKLRFKGKGGKERVVPMTAELQDLVDQFSADKSREASLIELGEKGVYLLVKRYGALAGMSEITPHDLRHAFGTHLLNVTGNIRIVQEILGHSNVNTTQTYTAVTLNNMEEAVKRLNSESGDNREARVFQIGEKKDSIAESRTWEQSPHQQQIRELARTMGEGLHSPSHLDKELWRELPIEFKPGKSYLPLGLVEINKDRQLKVKYYDIGTGTAEPHLVKGLFDHLRTSGKSRFTELIGDKGKFNELSTKAGRYSILLLKLLKIMVNEVRERKIPVDFHDEGKPGVTRWFFISAWNNVIQKSLGHSSISNTWYKPYENIPDTNNWQSRGGDSIIGVSNSKKNLKIFEILHKKLIIKYARNPLAKAIAIRGQELTDVAQEVKRLLREFNDMQDVPGRCDLC